MTRVRAAQTMGAAFATKGNIDRAFALYNKTIVTMQAEDIKKNLPKDMIDLMTEALGKCKVSEDKEVKVWALRAAIDTIYDKCVTFYAAPDTARFSPIHERIKTCINKVVELKETGKEKEGFNDFYNLLKETSSLKDYKKFSTETQDMVQKAIDEAKSTDDIDAAMLTMRKTLDQVYNEVRLPDIYTPCYGPVVSKL